MNPFRNRILIVYLLSGLIFPGFGQSKTGEKSFYDSIYNQYRLRLKEKFIILDSCVEKPGVNIPAVEIDRNNYCIDWGDANSNMSHYLAILATEYAINKRNQKCNETTIKELFYALLAFERLDLYSEAYLRSSLTLGGADTLLIVKPLFDINGFHLRDDVPIDFWKSFDKKSEILQVRSVFSNNRQALSQDNIIHNFEALALIAKLTGRVNIKNTPVVFYTPIIPKYLQNRKIWQGDTIDLPRWAQDIALRYITLLQHSQTRRLPQNHLGIKTHWYLTDPVNHELVPEGSGKDLDLGLFYHYGLIKATETITQSKIHHFPGILKSNQILFYLLFRYRITMMSKNTVLFALPFDDYKLRSLATVGNILGVETYRRLILYRDVSPVFAYEHFPLIWLILHAENTGFKLTKEEIENERRFYFRLFGELPTEGPNSHNTSKWRSTSRLVWPENLNRHPNSNSEFSGMDFMLLYNLFRLTFLQ